MMWFLANAEISFFDSLTITAICVLIVFAMLILLALIVAAFELFNKKQPVVAQEEAAPVQYTQPSSLKLEDIKDEDMMVAALVATIDYHEETKQDVRVVSIKQIG